MRRVVLVLCSVALATGLVALPARATPNPPLYRPPVDAPVVDPFRPPTTPYGPGNRGLEYGTAPGTEVRAAADGVVTFAGSVAGSLHVTLLHADGLRTTYSFLARVDVVVGQRVAQGDLLGTTRDHLHFGVRRGDAYLDPASLFDGGLPHVRLVPFDEPPGASPAGERRAIRQLIGGVDGLLGAGADWLRSGGQQLGTLGHYYERFGFPTAIVDNGLTLLSTWQRARRQSERPCTASGVATPAPTGRRVALLVAGLGSDSTRGTVEDVDTPTLGYAPADVLRFSYAGGRTPDATDGLSDIAATGYTPADTQTDLRATGVRLADLVEEVAARAPGVPIDLYAHSQGGVVARLALIELEQRHGVSWLVRLGLVATLGTPHQGADLATALHVIGSTRSGGALLDAYAATTGQVLDDDGASVAQLSESSELVAELASHPIPGSIRAVSIAARGDLIVPVPATRVLGATEVVVALAGPDAHRALPGSAATTRELGLALAGLPPGCQSFREALVDQGMGEAISYSEDFAGALGWLATEWADARQ